MERPRGGAFVIVSDPGDLKYMIDNFSYSYGIRDIRQFERSAFSAIVMDAADATFFSLRHKLRPCH